MTDRLVSARSLGWIAVVALVFGAPLLATAAPAAAHGFHLSVAPQVSDDGTVTVESLFTMSDGFVVLHEDDDGAPGDPVGHRPVSLGYHAGVDVTASPAFWDGVDGAETLWIAIHADDGDGEFDQDDDRIASFAGSNAARAVPVRRSDAGRTFVAAGGQTQLIPDPTVFVGRVGLAEDGFVAVRTDTENGKLTVGRAALDAGEHRLVRVPLNETYYATTDDYLSLEVVVYHDDGDGELTDDDAPVTVDGQPVATTLAVEKTNGTRRTPNVDGNASTASGDATETPGLVTTATPTPTETGTRTAGPTGAATSNTPGFTIVAAIVALAALLALGRVR